MSPKKRRELRANKKAAEKKPGFSFKWLISPKMVFSLIITITGMIAIGALPIWQEAGTILGPTWFTAIRPYILIIAVIAAFAVLTISTLHSENKKEEEKVAEEVIRKRFPIALLNEIEQPIVIFDENGLPVWGNGSFRKKAPRDILTHSANYKMFSLFTPVGFVSPESDMPQDNTEQQPLLPDYQSASAVLDYMSKTATPLRVYVPLAGSTDDRLSPNRAAPNKPTAASAQDEPFGFTPPDPANRSGLTGVWILHSYPYSVEIHSEQHTQHLHSLKGQTQKHNFFVTVMTDETELQFSKKQYIDDSPMCAYIVIDNLEELVSHEHASYRRASARVDAIIKEWAHKHEAVIKEYERDKYIMLFRHEQLSKMTANSFALLNSVSEVTVGNEEFPVTVSVGISKPTGTLLEKERSAQMALDTALKRGGGQAIVYTGDVSFSVYGGKEEYKPQNHSGVHTRVFAEKLIYQLKHCDNVIIMGHKNPDFDSIGSCAGMARLAMAFHKNVSMLVSNNDAAISEAITKLKTLPEYDLTFVTKTEAMNKLPNNTITICCDVNNTRQFEEPDIATSSDKLFIIDHHRKNEFTPTLSQDMIDAGLKKHEFLIIPSASSASELVAEILEHSLPPDARLETEEADIMLAGMLLDTKQFTRNTQAATFSAALYLRNCGADPSRAQALFKTDLEDYRVESGFGTDVFLERDCIAIAREDGEENTPTKRIAAAKTADRLLNVKNIRASFAVARLANDVFISARSDGSINVQLIMEAMGGGGHYNAAATMLRETEPNAAITKLCLEIRRYFNELDLNQPIPKAVSKEINALVQGKKNTKN